MCPSDCNWSFSTGTECSSALCQMFLKVGWTSWCIAYKTTPCFDLSMFHGCEGSNNLLVCTNMIKVLRQGNHLAHIQPTHVNGCANSLQQFTHSLKTILKYKGAVAGTEKIMGTPRRYIDWVGASTSNFIVIMFLNNYFKSVVLKAHSQLYPNSHLSSCVVNDIESHEQAQDNHHRLSHHHSISLIKRYGSTC